MWFHCKLSKNIRSLLPSVWVSLANILPTVFLAQIQAPFIVPRQRAPIPKQQISMDPDLENTHIAPEFSFGYSLL